MNDPNEQCELIEQPKRSFQVGVHAYECLPNLVFVKVPNERGRWMLVARCVAEVDCDRCKAIAGEPCFTPSMTGRRYTVGTHIARQIVWRARGKSRHQSNKPKIRLTTEDYFGPSMQPEET